MPLISEEIAITSEEMAITSEEIAITSERNRYYWGRNGYKWGNNSENENAEHYGPARFLNLEKNRQQRLIVVLCCEFFKTLLYGSSDVTFQ